MLRSVQQAVEHDIKMGIGTDAAMPFVTPIIYGGNWIILYKKLNWILF